MKALMFLGVAMMAAGASAQPAEVGYERGTLGFEQMVEGDWAAAEQQLLDSESELGADPARLLQLAEVYRQTGRTVEAASLYQRVLGSDDMNLVLADGRIVSAHSIASMRLSTQMQASR
ncbi:hypothetical protein B5C34_14625 [Pacificimonas flava]|uniref:Tetratricopeptide repeat protein n=2 Tax=Pacificimonas TaxID=1960290 RepID=A0A219B0K4_9SPHN|nr:MULTISPECIES: hypothetical protein [Pacificimonas]MBZ6379802.1 hypothetical protein [Pacificimonas aurantium]OWV31744.1 hypothetical protein B5C34_14625 [Pacificimonas flava]